jgi:predicted TIM-barrel fold metal-dependent hydrolase
VDEMRRCANFPQNRAFKLHFADADVDLRRPAHLEQVRRVFAAANALKLSLIVHFAPRFRYDQDYVELFLREVMPAAPDIPVQIAHLGGDGPGLDHPEGTLAFAAAIAADRQGTRNLWFDIAGLVTREMSATDAQAMAEAIRAIGLERILYASDGQPPNRPTHEHWTQVRRKLPLSAAELTTIGNNVAPYMRKQAP